MLHFFRVTLSLCCTFFVLHYLNVALLSSCTVFIFFFFFSCCRLFILNFLRGALMSHLFLCCTLFMLHLFLVGLFSCCTFFLVGLFSCCTFFLLHIFSCSTLFLLQYFHVTFFPVWTFTFDLFLVSFHGALFSLLFLTLRTFYHTLISCCAPFHTIRYHFMLRTFYHTLISCCGPFPCSTFLMLCSFHMSLSQSVGMAAILKLLLIMQSFHSS